MKFPVGTVLGTAGVVLTLLAIPALAEYTVTEREKQSCQRDYHAYCGEYGLGSEALRASMSRNKKKITHCCVAALVDAGEMSQAQANKLKGKASSTGKKSTAKKSTGKKPTYKKSTTKKSTTKKVTSSSSKKKR
jgi:hypothetical protein